MDVLEKHSANPGRAGHRLSLEASRIMFEARDTVSDFIGSESVNHVVFTSGGTEGLNTAILGLLLPGDHVITTVAEHNSVYRPLGHCEKRGISHSIARAEADGFTSAEEIEKSLKPSTKAVVVNHISNLTGIVQPLPDIIELCREKGLFLIVDGSQSCGYYDYHVELMGIDFLVGTGHKSLYGPQGTGFLYLRDPELLSPLKYGGTGSESESMVQPSISPDKFESGTPNLPGIAGLAGGLAFIKKYGLEKMAIHKDELRVHFVEELKKIKGITLYGDREDHVYGPVVALNVGTVGSSEISFALDYDFGIMTRSGLHCAPMLHRHMGTLEQGAVRFSFGYHNTHEEVDEGLRALREIAKKY